MNDRVGALLASGWLAVWLALLSATVGAGAWLAIGGLTGGRWLDAAAAPFARLARLTPLAAAGGLGFVLAAPLIYPWIDPSAGEPLPSAKAAWLSAHAFGWRSAGVLVLWSLMGLLAARRPTPFAAALWLLAWAISVTLAATDWLLARDPEFVSTDIGFFLALVQLATALAAILVARAGDRAGGGPGVDGGQWSVPQRADLAALLMTCALAITYLSSMQYLVSWSGNLPHAAAWYETRNTGAGDTIRLLAMMLGGVVPFAMLIARRWRRGSRTVRIAAASLCCGVLLHLAWMVAP
ncbi:MAG: hypothetical protein AB7P21_25940 [Lautropia sp.]